jgi:hypothetical protein
MGYSGAGEKLIHEKKPEAKISLHCPFKQNLIYDKTLCSCLVIFLTTGEPAQVRQTVSFRTLFIQLNSRQTRHFKTSFVLERKRVLLAGGIDRMGTKF